MGLINSLLGIKNIMVLKMNINLPDLFNCKVAIIGIGYVGLPLAVEITKVKKCLNTGKEVKRQIIGFDINQDRINDLNKDNDKTLEILNEDKKYFKEITFTSKVEDLANADIFIVTVPTPIDKAKKPNLQPLINANKTIGYVIKEKDLKAKTSKQNPPKPLIIFESTVYPGTTEEICVPIIEETSHLKHNEDFFTGYSPERINPGDKKNRLATIKKVTSGSNFDTAKWVNSFYSSFIKAGTHICNSIKVAEAAKIIENTQRDINIALVNELSIIFKKMGIDTLDVLEAAGTKWNFHPFRPGLVGGHCIGVDPYYLTYKSEELGYYPQVVLAGRRINDGMSKWIMEQIVLSMAKLNLTIGGARILILGLTFKENCPDLRNTKVFDLISLANDYGMKCTVIDPWVNPKNIKDINFEFHLEKPLKKDYSCVILAVGHDLFKTYTKDEWESLISKKNGIIFDLKGIVPRELKPIRI